MSSQDPRAYPWWIEAERLQWGGPSATDANYKDRICSENLIAPSRVQSSPA
jgi:hypothetical protein